MSSDGATRRDGASSTDQVRRAFADVLDAEVVDEIVEDTATVVRNRGGDPAAFDDRTASLARDRLRALARLEHGPPTKPAVLFLCVHNAGRSQMGAGWLRHLAGDDVDVFSAGSDPGVDTNPAAIEAMAEVGIDIATEHPKPWTDEIARSVDVVITMGCGDACPVYPGTRIEDWELADPAGQPVAAVRAVRDDIRGRVEQLVASLGLAES